METMQDFQSEIDNSFRKINEGDILKGTVIGITDTEVMVDIGYYTQAVIPAAEYSSDPKFSIRHDVTIGEEVEATVTRTDDGHGNILLSRKQASDVLVWDRLKEYQKAEKVFTVKIDSAVRSGVVAYLEDTRGFIPASKLALSFVEEDALAGYVGRTIRVRVADVDKEKKKLILSAKELLKEEADKARAAKASNVHVGLVTEGVVESIKDYGAFVDLGGIDGLLHITDLAWRRVRHPSEVISVGDEIEAKVLKFDQERQRVSLGLKQLGEDPWVGISRRYPQGTRLFGHVTNITDYGAFVEVEQGIEGLVHVSEMDWTNKNIHPSKVVQRNDEVEVMILEIDEERRRISLGMKQCRSNPWDDFAMNHKKGDKVRGLIKSITDFGVFIGLDGGIDGLVHLSDLSWNEPGEEAVRKFKKGDEVEAVVLGIDVERERISLGVKQLDGDPFTNYIATHEKNSVVTGTVKSVDAKGAVIALSDEIEGYLRASEAAAQRVEDLTTVLKEGDSVEAMIVNVDRKSRSINLSIRAKDQAEQTEALNRLSADSAGASGTTNLGALLKAKLEEQKQ